jgi:hypothetical protein
MTVVDEAMEVATKCPGSLTDPVVRSVDALMKSFLVAWLIAFGLVAAVAAGVSWFVGRAPDPPPVGRPVSVSESSEAEAGPFTEADAVQVVSRRLPTTASGDRVRNELLSGATVTYHSAMHWRVCHDDACWVAHGQGRYAEPENDAARLHEARPTTPR